MWRKGGLLSNEEDVVGEGKREEVSQGSVEREVFRTAKAFSGVWLPLRSEHFLFKSIKSWNIRIEKVENSKEVASFL